jgi:hypothetical protein
MLLRLRFSNSTPAGIKPVVSSRAGTYEHTPLNLSCLPACHLVYCFHAVQFLTGYFAATGWPVPATPVQYKRVGGIVQFTAQDMPFQSDVWGKIGNNLPNIDPNVTAGVPAFEAWASAQQYTIAMGLKYPRGTLYSAGAHVCSYRCMLSAYVAGGKGDWCLLHDVADAATLATASYCTNFPPYAIAAVYPTNPAYP